MALMGRSSARPKLVEPSGFASPGRAELALAIASRAAADEALTRLETSRQTLFEGYLAARRAVTEAEQGLQRAQDAAAAHALAVASGGATEPPAPVKAARAALLDAEDGLAAADTARNGLNGNLEAATHDLAVAKRRVEAACVAVLREAPQVAGMLGEVHRLSADLVAAGRALSWLVWAGILPGGDAPNPLPRDHPNYDILRAKQFVDALPIDYLPGARIGHLVPIEAHPAAAAWKDALAALKTDANAPLPGEKP